MPAKILITEDNAEIRELLILVLKEQGYEIISADNGQTALELISLEQPNLIITDIEMPKVDGIQLIRELRRQPETRNVPILVMTAYHSGSITEALDAGANMAAHKPVLLETLINLIQQLLATSIFIYLTRLYCVVDALMY